MDLLEIFETGIVSEILPTDIYAILMLRITSKKCKKVIDEKNCKVDVCLKKCDLSLEDFFKILKKISDNFIINRLELQHCKLKTIINHNTYRHYKDNFCYDFSYFDIIFKLCPFLSYLSFKDNLMVPFFYLLDKFKSDMPHCKVSSYYHRDDDILDFFIVTI